MYQYIHSMRVEVSHSMHVEVSHSMHVEVSPNTNNGKCLGFCLTKTLCPHTLGAQCELFVRWFSLREDAIWWISMPLS